MALDLHGSARLIGSIRWVEQRLFEVLGGFAVDEPDPAVAALFGVHGHQHAWHAELWRDRTPSIPGVDADAIVTAPDALVAALAAVAASPGTAERLAAVYRVVLPRLAECYRRWQTDVDPTLDGPTARVLTLVTRDDADQIAAGSALLTSRIGDTATARRAAAHLGEIEAAMVEAGGLAGLYPGGRE